MPPPVSLPPTEAVEPAPESEVAREAASPTFALREALSKDTTDLLAALERDPQATSVGETLTVLTRQVESAMRLLYQKEKPVLYVGGGVILSDAAAELTEFANLMGIPVTPTLMGMGAFPGTDPLSMGMLGMHGTYAANMAISHCDLILAVGARFDDRVTGKIDEFAPHAKIVHVDIDPTSIQKNVPVDIPIVGDLGDVLKKMIKLVKGTKEATAYRGKIAPWRTQIRSRCTYLSNQVDRSFGRPLA